MTNSNKFSVADSKIPNIVDWSNVRSIYKKLSLEFDTLLVAFDSVRDDETILFMDHLLTCIDCVDRELDDLVPKSKREEMMGAILEYLSNDRTHFAKRYSRELQNRLSIFKSIIISRNIQETIGSAVQIIFRNTEDKRQETEINPFLDCYIDEGKATAVMTLSLMPEQASDTFKRFFTALCGVMGLADLVLDFRSDYKKRQILIRPTLRIYVRLIGLLTKEGMKLLGMIPHKRKFLIYCYRMIRCLLRN